MDLHRLFKTDIYDLLMHFNMYQPLASYLKVTNDQTYRLPVALSHTATCGKDFIDCIDRLDGQELQTVLEQVKGDTQAYYLA